MTFIKEIMSQEPAPAPDEAPLLLSLLRHGLQSFLIVIIGGSIAVVFLLNWVNPTTTYYIWQEKQRLGNVEALWTPMDDIAPVLARSVVAAEDANFCLHWGFDLAAIRTALADGGRRGASTLTQQTVKNVFLWPARSWVRKAFVDAVANALRTQRNFSGRLVKIRWSQACAWAARTLRAISP